MIQLYQILQSRQHLKVQYSISTKFFPSLCYAAFFRASGLVFGSPIQHVSKSCCVLNRVRLFATPWTAAHQASLSMGILQARILEWVAMPSCRGSSQPRGQTQVSHTAGGWILNHLSHQGRPRCFKSCQFSKTTHPFILKNKD